jgi:hypothetical protein
MASPGKTLGSLAIRGKLTVIPKNFEPDNIRTIATTTTTTTMTTTTTTTTTMTTMTTTTMTSPFCLRVVLNFWRWLGVHVRQKEFALVPKSLSYKIWKDGRQVDKKTVDGRRKTERQGRKTGGQMDIWKDGQAYRNMVQLVDGGGAGVVRQTDGRVQALVTFFTEIVFFTESWQ